MIIGIFSDSHLGFSTGDRFTESFDRFTESLKIFEEKRVDFVLHAGDLFDNAVPTQEVWLKTFKCFSNNSKGFSVLKKNQRRGVKEVLVKGTPIIAIHGTHEHRGKDFANALDVLEESASLLHLHAGFVELRKGEESVFVHGMGGVPEKFAKIALSEYDPTPISGKTNILLLHQSFTEYLPVMDESVASLSVSDLPKGFDLIINGHLHWSKEEVFEEKRFLLTGSAIFTQMKNLESKKKKGVFLFDTNSKKIEFVPFPNQRKLFYEKISFVEAKPIEVINLVKNKLREFNLSEAKGEYLPLVRLKLVGSLAKGFTQADVLIDVSEYKDKAIFSVSKEFSAGSFQKKIESLKLVHGEKKSVSEFGIEILEKNVVEAGLREFDSRRVFELLASNELEKTKQLLLLKKNQE